MPISKSKEKRKRKTGSEDGEKTNKKREMDSMLFEPENGREKRKKRKYTPRKKCQQLGRKCSHCLKMEET